jgi:hypothetical protein
MEFSTPSSKKNLHKIQMGLQRKTTDWKLDKEKGLFSSYG